MSIKLFLLYLALIASVNSNPIKSLKITRETAKLYLKGGVINFPFLDEEGKKCALEVINATEIKLPEVNEKSFDELEYLDEERPSRLDSKRLGEIYDDLLILCVTKLSHVENFEHEEEIPDEIKTEESISCSKFQLSQLKPNSEFLQNFTSSDFNSEGCNNSYLNQMRELVEDSFKELQLTKCSFADFFTDEFKINVNEMILMANSNATGSERKTKKKKIVKLLYEPQIECIMREFDE